MGDAFSIKFDESIIDKLQKLNEDIQEKVIRPTAYAGAVVYYQEMKSITPIGKTGTLNRSIYHYYDKKLSTPTHAVYSIGPNKKTAPHWHLLEFGTVKMAARPFIRNTYTNKSAAALENALKTMKQKLGEVL